MKKTTERVVCYECGMDLPHHYERCSMGSVDIPKLQLQAIHYKISECRKKNPLSRSLKELEILINDCKAIK